MALLENVRRDVERYENAKEAVTQQQIDTSKANLAQYEGIVRADQASVENFKLQLSYCRVTAPISGRAGLRLVDKGNMIRASDPGIVVIAQEQPISVVFSIPEDSLPQVRRSIAAGRELAVDAYDRGMKTRLASGVLFAVDNQIDATTGTVKLKAQFTNDDHGLFPNQFVNIRMLTEVQENVTLIPNSAIQLSGTTRFVFVVKPDETVERRTVTVGRTEGEKTVVTEGLAPSEVVVTEGLDRLQSGSKVMTRTPIPEAPAGAEGGRRGGGGGKGGGKREPKAPSP
jgi:multidrug efflux system membrane fusion protein